MDPSERPPSGAAPPAESPAAPAAESAEASAPESPAAPAAEPGDRGYPAHLEADVVLSDGGTVHLRPIRPSDAAEIVALHSRFSERTRYLRYFSPYPRIPERDLNRFVRVDHRSREALVAELGDELVAVGRYERLSPEEAEVAFVVEDAHQRRGLGSVLLEHLAAAAGQRGIRRFVAEVLPENGSMIRVFSDAGYTLERSYDDGVVHLRFDVTPTPRSVEVARERERRTEAQSIARLLRPASVAVVGVSRDPDAVGRQLLRHLLEAGFHGQVYAVTPYADDLGGAVEHAPAYRSLRDLPGPVGLTVVAVPAPFVPDVVDDAAAAGVRGLVVVSAGFGETGPDGRAAERRLVERARANGMRVVGPNCLGIQVTDRHVRLNASLVPVLPYRGRTGFFCQSGALGAAILQRATDRGLGFSSMVSAGNRADVSGNDLLQYWQDDPATDVALMYLETFGNPRKFSRVARRLARHKPVVVVKSRAVAPALAADAPAVTEPALRALFTASGVIKVDTVEDALDVAALLASQPLPAGDRVAVVGNSSALNALAAEACTAEGLRVTGEPVDVAPEASPTDLAAVLRPAVADPEVDALVVSVAPALTAPSGDYAGALLAEVGDCGKPVVSTFLGMSGVPDRLRRQRPSGKGAAGRGSVPSYPSPEAAVRALALVSAYAAWRRRPLGETPTAEQLGAYPKTAAQIAANVLAANAPAADPPDADGVVELTGELAAGLLGAVGVAVTPSTVCDSADEAVEAARAYGYPVAVKAAGQELRNRVDLGTVRLDVGRDGDGDAAVRAAYADVTATALAPAVLVQPMVPPGVPCVAEIADDQSFGPVVGFGLGGVATELLGDRAWRAAPLTAVEARDLVRAPRAAPLLSGYRAAGVTGQQADTTALADLLLRLGLLADLVPEVRSVELNPVLAGTSGLSVLHAAVRVGRPPGRADSGPRRLR